MLTELLAALEHLSATQAALLGTLATLGVAVPGLVFGRFDAHRTAKKTAFDMVTAAAEEMREDVRLAREEASSVRQRLVALENERDQLRDRISLLEKQLSATIRERDGLQERVVALDAEITRLRLTLAGVLERQDHMHAGLLKAVE